MRERSPETAEHLRGAVSAVMSKHPDVLGVYLFGSRLTGEAHEDSDVDLGVLFDHEASLAEVVDLETELERALGRRIDLVDVGRSNPFLALEIVRGERIWEGDGLRCDLFDLYVLRHAGDLAHFERERPRDAPRRHHPALGDPGSLSRRPPHDGGRGVLPTPG